MNRVCEYCGLGIQPREDRTWEDSRGRTRCEAGFGAHRPLVASANPFVQNALAGKLVAKAVR